MRRMMLFAQAGELAKAAAESQNWAVYLLALVIVGVGSAGLVYLRSMTTEDKARTAEFVGMCKSFAATDLAHTQVLTEMRDGMRRHSELLKENTQTLAGVTCHALEAMVEAGIDPKSAKRALSRRHRQDEDKSE